MSHHDLRGVYATISAVESMYTARMERDRIAGCLFGAALGDALAAPVEFLPDAAMIVAQFGPDGPPYPDTGVARVTDDTQMLLAVGEALVAAKGQLDQPTLVAGLTEAFVDWSISPDNNRAPGATCMTACKRLAKGLPFRLATMPGSKGCGANMRVQPVAFLPEALRAPVAQLQAALTHGHPTALAASDLTAFAIADLASGGDPDTLVERLNAYALTQRTVYHADWLGDLWGPVASSPAAFIERGWDECLAVLNRLGDAARSPGYWRDTDPCGATGEGWVAEEALATGLLCFLLFRDDPVAALRRAAVTAGDSDSIACLAGSFAGAQHGLAAWPDDWLDRIEYRERLAALTDSLGDLS